MLALMTKAGQGVGPMLNIVDKVGRSDQPSAEGGVVVQTP